jgi:hypothetical protein
MPGFPFADEDRWLTLLTEGWGTDGGGSADRGAAPPSG